MIMKLNDLFVYEIDVKSQKVCRCFLSESIKCEHVSYHCGSSEHKMKEDYEAKALAKAEAKGPKEVIF